MKSHLSRITGLGLRAVAFWMLGALACAAELTTKSDQSQPPEEVSSAIKAVLGKDCYHVLEDGKPLFDFWLSQATPLKETPASLETGLDALETTALIGIVKIHQERRDYRDDELYKGVFTMRYGKIPADGNHLGATEYSHFAVLIPAAQDRSLDDINSYKKMTRASSKETASSHPMIMSLRPLKEKPATIPTLTSPIKEHQCVVVSAKGKMAGEDQATELTFEIVVEGFGEI